MINFLIYLIFVKCIFEKCGLLKILFVKFIFLFVLVEFKICFLNSKIFLDFEIEIYIYDI